VRRQEAQLTQAEQLIGELRGRLAEKDARIAQLERQLATYARSVDVPPGDPGDLSHLRSG
jgi:hypothetical protein